MIAILYFIIIYFYSAFFWILITKNPEFFSMFIPGFFAVYVTYYLIDNQYLPIT